MALLIFLVMILITPPKASEPYCAEALPRTISIRSIFDRLKRPKA